MKKIAIIDKQPSRNNYAQYFPFEFDHYHMSSVPVPKLLKKDVDLVVDLDPYDMVILVGSEAAKEYAKITSVTNYAGQLVNGKFIAITNPAMLHFKPEGKPDFERAVGKILKYYEGVLTNSSESGDFKGINNSEEALEYLLEILNSEAKYVAADTETTSLYPRDGYVLGLSLSYKLKHGRYILTDILDERHIDLLQRIFKEKVIVFHNLKFDYKMIHYHLGLEFNRSDIHDTMVMHYVLDENDSHGLKELALKYTDYGDYDAELDTFKKQYCADHGIKQEDFTYDLIPYHIMCKYASIDTAVTLELFFKFHPIIEKSDKFRFVYRDILIRGTLFLMDMEEVGIPIHRERMEATGIYLDTQIEEAKQEVFAFEAIKQFEADSGKIFNPNSVPMLRTILFDYLNLTPTGKLTKTGALSTDVEVLEELSSEHPLPAAILKVRQLGKIRSSYVAKILPELDRDGRIRTNFNLIFTTSGRLSSSGKFNAQQIPRDSPIKGCIHAPAGYKIVSQDLATAEMYYAAVLSKDKNLQKVFIDGGDFHSSIAKMVFKLEAAVEHIKELHKLERQSSKAVSFGILFGSGPAKVMESVNKEGGNMTLFEAKEVIADYYNTFKQLKRWLNDRKTFIETNGYTYSHFGRKRRLVNVFSSDKGIAAHEVRSGINAEIQSLASDMNLLGAMDTHDECKKKGIDAKIFMLVHDSIVALVKDEDVECYCEILKRNTQKDRGCNIPLCPIGVDQEIGNDYSFGGFDKKYDIIDSEQGPMLRVKPKSK
jgi:DNA polymerase I-like protein with 3'-5' exonuclease and polymerase domains